MKTKSLLKIFGATLAVCAVSGAIVCVDTALTADASAPADAVFEMEQKASVRLGVNADDAGIRFRVVMNETMKNYIVNNDNVTCGFLIFQQKDLVSTSGTITDNYHENINVKVDIPCDESLIYQDGENYYANGALTQIKVTENFDRELTCVAYTYDGTNYEYADLNPEFSRSVYDVSSAAYIYEPTKRERLTATYSVLGDTAPVLIRSYDDLAAISAEVTEKGTTFANVKFELGTNITLPDEYVALPSEFAGTIDFGDYSVIAAKNQKIAVVNSSVTNARYVEVVDGTPYLMDVDSTNSSNYKANGTAMSLKSQTGTTTGSYSGEMVEVSAANDLKGTLALAWTGTQLQALKESGYKSVTFNVMAYNSALAGQKLFVSVKNFTFVGQLQPWILNQWYNVSVNIDDVAEKMTENTLTLFDTMTRTGAMTYFYFGDVTLSTEQAPEMTTLWNVGSGYAQLKNVSAVTTDATGLISGVEINHSGFYDTELNEGYLNFNANSGIQNQIFVQLDYTVDQLELLKAQGYTGISTTFYVKAAETNTSGSLTFYSEGLFGTIYFIGVGKTEEGKTAYNTKITLTATIDQLIASMNKSAEQNSSTTNKPLNYLWLGYFGDRLGASALQFRFTDIVLTKE